MTASGKGLISSRLTPGTPGYCDYETAMRPSATSRRNALDDKWADLRVLTLYSCLELALSSVLLAGGSSFRGCVSLHHR